MASRVTSGYGTQARLKEREERARKWAGWKDPQNHPAFAARLDLNLMCRFKVTVIIKVVSRSLVAVGGELFEPLFGGQKATEDDG